MVDQRMVGSLDARKIVDGIGEFIASGLFAITILTFCLVWTAALLILMFWPQPFGAEGGFPTAFKVWCFGYDPLTGKFDFARMALVFIDPIFFGAVIGMIWRNDVILTLKNRVKAVSGVFITITALVCGSLYLLSLKQKAVNAKLGGNEVKVIRNFSKAPVIESLLDQDGQTFVLKKGQVNVVSAFYAHCKHTCPLIIKELKSALKASTGGEQVNVVLVTLDPENDTPEALKEFANREAPEWKFLSGPKEKVDKVLNDFQVARAKDASGNIGHSNIFYIIDRQGRLAFRIGLGTSQEDELNKVFKILLNEKG